MGITHVEATVGNPVDGSTERVRCLVDSGAVYSLIPGAVLTRIGIASHSEREFVLANGEVIRRRSDILVLEDLRQKRGRFLAARTPHDIPPCRRLPLAANVRQPRVQKCIPLLIGPDAERFQVPAVMAIVLRRELRPTALPLKATCRDRGRLAFQALAR